MREEKEEKSDNALEPVNGSKEVLGDNRVRTPRELKVFYLNLRDNDPYYKQQNKKNKLKGIQSFRIT